MPDVLKSPDLPSLPGGGLLNGRIGPPQLTSSKTTTGIKKRDVPPVFACVCRPNGTSHRSCARGSGKYLNHLSLRSASIPSPARVVCTYMYATLHSMPSAAAPACLLDALATLCRGPPASTMSCSQQPLRLLRCLRAPTTNQRRPPIVNPRSFAYSLRAVE